MTKTGNYKTPTLSIIVPVYKVEQYLPVCIDSIRVQTFTDWELILVDDGSPDGSGAICDRYAARDSRIKVVHKSNGGVSAARNDALDIARGRYITFVDSDDCIDIPTTYEDNIEILETHPEVGIVQYPGGESEANTNVYSGKADILEAIVKWHITGYLWDKVFRACIFENIRLPEGVQFAEDTWCLIDMADCAQAVYVSDKGHYFYRKRDDSAVNTFTATQCLDLFRMSHHLLHKLQETAGVSVAVRTGYFMTTYRRLLDAKIVNDDMPGFKGYITELSATPPTPHIRQLANCALSVKLKLWLLMMKCIGVKRFANCYVRFVRWRTWRT